MLLYLKQEHKEKKKKGVILDYSVWVCFIFNKKKKITKIEGGKLRAFRMIQGLKGLIYSERLEKVGLYCLEKRILWGTSTRYMKL